MAGETVLAVDDREDSLSFLREYVLEPNGYRMIQAHNGIEVLDLLNAHQVDLIISDLVMPQMVIARATKRMGTTMVVTHPSPPEGSG